MSIKKFSQSDLDSLTKRGEAMPETVGLDEGECIEGILEGEGAPVESKDKQTGEVKTLPTFRFRLDDNSRADVLSNYQMGKDLPQLVGRRVWCGKMGKEKMAGGQTVNKMKIVDLGPASDAKAKKG